MKTFNFSSEAGENPWFQILQLRHAERRSTGEYGSLSTATSPKKGTTGRDPRPEPHSLPSKFPWRHRTPSSFTAPVWTEEPGTPSARGTSPASCAHQGAEPRATPPPRAEPRRPRPRPPPRLLRSPGGGAPSDPHPRAERRLTRPRRPPRICLSPRLRAGLWGPGFYGPRAGESSREPHQRRRTLCAGEGWKSRPRR